MFRNIFKRKPKNFDDIVELNNEFGEEVKFHFLDLVEYEEKEYVILLPVDSDDEGMVVILQLVNSDENTGLEEYVTLNDDNVLSLVFEIFKIRNKDRYTFI